MRQHYLPQPVAKLYAALQFIFEYIADKERGPKDLYPAFGLDAPMFILLGRDAHAHAAVRKWADDRETMIRAGIKPPDDMRMVWEARECADAMEQFHIHRAARRRGELAGAK